MGKSVEVNVTAQELGFVEVYAYFEDEEVSATVEVVGIGTYTTPFSLELAPGNYTLNATYETYSESKTATIVGGELTTVNFTFAPPPEIPLWVLLLVASGGLIIANILLPEEF